MFNLFAKKNPEKSNEHKLHLTSPRLYSNSLAANFFSHNCTNNDFYPLFSHPITYFLHVIHKLSVFVGRNVIINVCLHGPLPVGRNVSD